MKGTHMPASVSLTSPASPIDQATSAGITLSFAYDSGGFTPVPAPGGGWLDALELRVTYPKNSPNAGGVFIAQLLNAATGTYDAGPLAGPIPDTGTYEVLLQKLDSPNYNPHTLAKSSFDVV